MTWRRSMFALGLLILLAAAMNVPMAVPMLRSRTDRSGPASTHVRGDEAAVLGWPYRTPHSTPWPAPGAIAQRRAFGYSFTGVWAANPSGDSGFQMEHELTGWPLPVLEHVQMWWAWDDPAWKLDDEPDPALMLHWPGVLLNPLLVGGGAWVVLVLPFLTFHVMRRRRRRRRNQCLECGYPIGASLQCTECGADIVLRV